MVNLIDVLSSGDVAFYYIVACTMCDAGDTIKQKAFAEIRFCEDS